MLNPLVFARVQFLKFNKLTRLAVERRVVAGLLRWHDHVQLDSGTRPGRVGPGHLAGKGQNNC